jgi:pyruvate dehydrogenase E2 component (dihydrolipoamide acetyltransferase)
VGAAQQKVVQNDAVVEGGEKFKVVTALQVTLSCDHRVVDGAVGARWLQEFKALVENPVLLLL